MCTSTTHRHYHRRVIIDKHSPATAADVRHSLWNRSEIAESGKRRTTRGVVNATSVFDTPSAPYALIFCRASENSTPVRSIRRRRRKQYFIPGRTRVKLPRKIAGRKVDVCTEAAPSPVERLWQICLQLYDTRAGLLISL